MLAKDYMLGQGRGMAQAPLSISSDRFHLVSSTKKRSRGEGESGHWWTLEEDVKLRDLIETVGKCGTGRVCWHNQAFIEGIEALFEGCTVEKAMARVNRLRKDDRDWPEFKWADEEAVAAFIFPPERSDFPEMHSD